ncbi:hypothetical protein KKE85_00935 [Patescibacteria group bacterium]|nr:hypothetical protein [Patescibacteria group bacterium]MBU4078166.1 hypothetical protein [Patescibacteria group bacterium]MBU4161991.1 hypothetical protein [Patescibacteria group bacterium]
MTINYEKVIDEIFSNLAPRKREVLERRFGLLGQEPLTLQAIGDQLKITRERVRQLENNAFELIREQQGVKLQKPFEYLSDYFDEHGGVRGELMLLDDLGQDKFRNHVLLLLNLGDDFHKFKETDDFFPFWTTDPKKVQQVKILLNSLIKEFKNTAVPLAIEEVGKRVSVEVKIPVLISYIDISKFVFESPFGLYGLVNWPEIRPRGLKDQAYLVLKRENRPLHFMEIADLIGKLPSVNRKILPESVHNELIRNQRFVLIGRGMYALKEWGYEPGTVKDILIKILKQSKKGLTKEEILENILEQRKVQASTILLNLQDKSLFRKDKQGRYFLVK